MGCEENEGKNRKNMERHGRVYWSATFPTAIKPFYAREIMSVFSLVEWKIHLMEFAKASTIYNVLGKDERKESGLEQTAV